MPWYVQVAFGLVVLALGLRLMLIGWGVLTPPARSVGRLGRSRATGTLVACIGLAFIDTGITKLFQATGAARSASLWIYLLLAFGAVACGWWRIVEGRRDGVTAPAQR